MKQPRFKILCYLLLVLLWQGSFAQGDNKIDTLILNDNSTITGQIENLYQLITLDGNVAKREFKIDTAWGKRIDISVSDVKYVKAFGTTFEHVELTSGAHQFMEVISAGKVTLYLWRRITNVPGGGVVNTFNDNKIFKPATGKITENDIETYMIRAKDKWYEAAFIKKKFDDLFGDCPQLTERAKNKGFNYKSIGEIVREYNACK